MAFRPLIAQSLAFSLFNLVGEFLWKLDYLGNNSIILKSVQVSNIAIKFDDLVRSSSALLGAGLRFNFVVAAYL
jgi:hypothetical protein